MLRLLTQLVRRRPSAEAIVADAMERRDFRTAALFVLTGAAEVLSEEPATVPAFARLQKLERALALQRQ